MNRQSWSAQVLAGSGYEREAWYATDNGFSSVEFMTAEHAPIVGLAGAVLRPGGGNVLDLGCGNGALLRKIGTTNRNIVPYGIEMDDRRLMHARLIHEPFAENFVAGDLFESDGIWHERRRYRLAIFMPGRLVNVAPDKAFRLKERLRQHCDAVLVYCYADWRTSYGGLLGLADQMGVSLLSWNAGVSASLATFL